jgi:PHD/YefM family antitoxin component YafN of YafNO toxin-antitoxin module
MTNEQERLANERRRQEAALIIQANEKRKRIKQTDELLLDQEALKRAAILAGLEKPDEPS